MSGGWQGGLSDGRVYWADRSWGFSSRQGWSLRKVEGHDLEYGEMGDGERTGGSGEVWEDRGLIQAITSELAIVPITVPIPVD